MEHMTSSASRPVMLNDGTRLLRINPSNIAYIQADRVYCHIYMIDGKTDYTISHPMGEIEKHLPTDTFVRIHRSFIINIWMVKMIMGRLVTLTNGQQFTVGEQYLHSLDDCFIIFGQPRPKD